LPKNNKMNLSIEKNENYVIIKFLDDKITENTSTELKNQLIALNKEGIKNVILDLSKVTQCDSSGLKTLLESHKMYHKSNGSFIICGLNKSVKEIIINSTKSNEILSICPSIEEATDLIFMEEIERDLLKDAKNE
jgi:anti-sigma B factor antagonist